MYYSSSSPPLLKMLFLLRILDSWRKRCFVLGNGLERIELKNDVFFFLLQKVFLHITKDESKLLWTVLNFGNLNSKTNECYGVEWRWCSKQKVKKRDVQGMWSEECPRAKFSKAVTILPSWFFQTVNKVWKVFQNAKSQIWKQSGDTCLVHL